MNDDARIPVALIHPRRVACEALAHALPARGCDVAGSGAALHDVLPAIERGIARVVMVALDHDRTGALEGLEQVQSLRWRRPDVPVVVLSPAVDPALVEQSMQLGVCSLVPARAAGLDELARALRAASRGERWFPVDAAPATGRSGTADARLGLLSHRERQVLAHVGQGHENPKIAAELGIGARTVKAHIAALYKKLAADNRVELALIARELGLRPLPEERGR